MPRIQPIDPTHASPEIRTTLSAVKAKLGMVPNLFATFARSPAVLDGYLGFSDALAKGALSPKQREIVALAVAQANGCQYCLSAHSLLGKGAGLSAEAIDAARRGQARDAIDYAVAALARRLVETRGQVADTDLAAARAAGMDDGRIVEVIAHVALNVLTNFMNNVAQTEIDFPTVEVALGDAA